MTSERLHEFRLGVYVFKVPDSRRFRHAPGDVQRPVARVHQIVARSDAPGKRVCWFVGVRPYGTLVSEVARVMEYQHAYERYRGDVGHVTEAGETDHLTVQ